jgi:hypothetical protein
VSLDVPLPCEKEGNCRNVAAFFAVGRQCWRICVLVKGINVIEENRQKSIFESESNEKQND